MIKAAVLEEPRVLKIREFPKPSVAPDDLLIRVDLVGICASDVEIYNGNITWAKYPLIMGHEVVGTVVEMGENAHNTFAVQVGDRVTVEPYIPCGSCSFCFAGNYSICKQLQCYGITMASGEPPHLFGGYSEFMYIKKGSLLYKVASDVPLEAACMSSVIGNGVRWVETKGRVGLHRAVVIVGCGVQGLASVIAAKEAGANPIAVVGLTADLQRFKLAEEYGATHTINVEEEDVEKAVMDLTQGEGADVVIEASGAPKAIQSVFDLVKPMGRIVLAGVTGMKEIGIITDKFVNKEMEVYGGLGQSGNVETAVKIINSKKYAIEKMVTHTFPLEEADQGITYFIDNRDTCIRAGLLPK